ncbi:MAG: hypothetical protein ACQESR_12455 [Planctomycetota bacterium]
METCPAQAVLPLVGLAAEKVIRDRHILQPVTKPDFRFQNSLDDSKPEWWCHGFS